MSKKIVVTGGTGAIGKMVCKLLTTNGYHVSILSRTKIQNSEYQHFKWDIENRKIESGSLNDAYAIIHLAGANIAEKRWTELYKKEIIASRTDAVCLIYEELKRINHLPEVFISASATGFYGSENSEKIFNENDSAGTDFVGLVGDVWENSLNIISEQGVRTVVLRTGVVLDKNSGALAKLLKPAKAGFASQLGTGKQFMPWIHLEDIGRMYVYALKHAEIQGVYNAVAPQHLTNRMFTKAIARTLGKPMLAPPVPAFILKAMMGEAASIVIKGSRVSSEKISKTGFKFKFPEIYAALNDILNH